MTTLLSDDERRMAAALRVKQAHDIDLPDMPYWNDEPCDRHMVEAIEAGDVPVPVRGCPDCGATFLRHQRIGVVWAYLARKGLLADTVGLGKTIEIGGLLALLKSRGELTGRAIYMTRNAQSMLQARDEIIRFCPRLSVQAVTGSVFTRAQRIERYTQNWDVLFVNYHTFLQDVEIMVRLEPLLLIVDDVDPLRNETKTAAAIKRVARDCPRVVVASGTPLQNRLHELHSLLEPVGGLEVFGSSTAFETRYIRKESITIYDQRRQKRIHAKKVTGYKNMEEFKRLLQPLVLRRTHRDLDNDDLPTVMPEDIWLTLYPSQRAKYAELQKGVLRIITEEGEAVKHATAMAKLVYGAQVCAGLATIGEEDGEQSSIKMDWIMDKLTGDMADDKVVIFSQFKNTIRALHRRFEQAGIGYATIWGDEPNAVARRAEQTRFWNDPSCRVCIGTSAMEQSLNLQISKVLINIDMLLNPARMEQLAGRIRRLGSAHTHVWVFNLLAEDTQEERYLPILEQKQGLADYVWGEASDLFAPLSAMQLLQLIRP